MDIRRYQILKERGLVVPRKISNKYYLEETTYNNEGDSETRLEFYDLDSLRKQATDFRFLASQVDLLVTDLEQLGG